MRLVKIILKLLVIFQSVIFAGDNYYNINFSVNGHNYFVDDGIKELLENKWNEIDDIIEDEIESFILLDGVVTVAPLKNIRFKVINVTINIYNVMGRLVKSLNSKNLKAGFHIVQWNSTSNSGQKVPSGMYIVRMNAISTNGKKSYSKSQKVVLLK
ncbi:MAG: T9SS type A sorting domain-containing protein [Candidatus Marinimicrobia bacterium]|jgi:hypothetical protein|nr:T9SS type A sorting domain-containing protein [Candidatus Neomarinimicrobiota bacterium]MBT3502637.1 T9SS type A sorting domain-containing protein [Candidatus Neomarinimicrobiota bacterium]MBT3839933.1 T9SS type A sorting domain-containing protein [Candidatus Neomarinimicrobiota bacterium]MBT4000192.1 T9SS type A sorting domain-containing protein [Candidatus Neomarinimicrobiota bacterium]MBT4281730.1 T9SS type A sorting domain-containing protein [Candidatus Neomarinimicrobiota bacterium]